MDLDLNIVDILSKKTERKTEQGAFMSDPIEDVLKHTAITLNKYFEELCGRKMGFVIALYELDNSSAFKCASNTEKESSVEVLRNAIDFLENLKSYEAITPIKDESGI